MCKRSLIRFGNGFCCSIAITLVIDTLVMLITQEVPMLPEYMARFEQPVIAFAVQMILIGVMSGVTSAGTVVFETRKIGIVIQSLMFLVIMLAAWIPIACYLWSFHKYLPSMLSTIGSIVVTYGICWAIQYRHCQEEIESINAILKGKE